MSLGASLSTAFFIWVIWQLQLFQRNFTTTRMLVEQLRVQTS